MLNGKTLFDKLMMKKEGMISALIKGKKIVPTSDIREDLEKAREEERKRRENEDFYGWIERKRREQEERDKG